MTKMKIAGGLVLMVGFVSGVIYFTASTGKAKSGDLTSRPNYLNLKTHVEKLAEIDQICHKQDSTTCYCELAQVIRDEHDAINRLLMDDPSLRGFVIPIRQPASEALRYDLNKLPKVPDETKCLSTVSAPTLIDDQQDI